MTTFGKAYAEMRKGKKIAHAYFQGDFQGGYWAWENDTIMMHYADGRVLDIRQTEDVALTFRFITTNWWHVYDDEDGEWYC